MLSQQVLQDVSHPIGLVIDDVGEYLRRHQDSKDCQESNARRRQPGDESLPPAHHGFSEGLNVPGEPVNVARKLIASWEKRYEVSTAAETWKLKRIWSRELTGEQRAIFNLG